MEMITVPVSIPKEMAPYLDWEDQGLSLEQNALLLYPMVRDLVISHGRAAEILGMKKWDLIALYDRMGFPYLDQSHQDLDEEISGFSRLREKRSLGILLFANEEKLLSGSETEESFSELRKADRHISEDILQYAFSKIINE